MALVTSYFYCTSLHVTLSAPVKSFLYTGYKLLFIAQVTNLRGFCLTYNWHVFNMKTVWFPEILQANKKVITGVKITLAR